MPFLIYLSTYTLTSFIHMMSVNEGNVAIGFLLASFHGYSLLIVYSLLMQFIEGKEEEAAPEEKAEEEETGLTEKEAGDDDIVYIA